MRLRLSTLLQQILVIAMAVIVVPAIAQDVPPGQGRDGEIEDLQIEIIKERQITLPPANRNFQKIPPRPAEQVPASVIYDFREFNFQAPEVSPRIRPLRLRQESNSQTYGGYLSLGYGNYGSPYAEAFLNSGKDQRK